MSPAKVHRLPVKTKRMNPTAVAPPLSQRVALVSGANRGIGLEVARQLASLGVTVFVGSRELAKGEKVAKAIRGTGGDAYAVRLDVTRDADMQAAIDTIDDRCGRLDILVNNAGGYFDNDARTSKPDVVAIRGAFDTNVLGAWCLTAAALPLMRRHGYGRVVNVSSECAVRSICGDTAPAYRISKAALNAYTQVIARELQGSGITVNAVCPGWTATAMGGSGGRPAAESAEGIVWAALLQESDVASGEFYRDRVRVTW